MKTDDFESVSSRLFNLSRQYEDGYLELHTSRKTSVQSQFSGERGGPALIDFKKAPSVGQKVDRVYTEGSAAQAPRMFFNKEDYNVSGIDIQLEDDDRVAKTPPSVPTLRKYSDVDSHLQYPGKEDGQEDGKYLHHPHVQVNPKGDRRFLPAEMSW